MNEFGSSAQKLAKNPLGIIALFIVLIYGIAGLVIGTSGSDLEPAHKTILVWFFAVFPFAVLFSFVWLVSKHHSKLYSPSDFRNDEGFLRALTPEEQKIRLEKEAIEFMAESGHRPSSTETVCDSNKTISPQLKIAKENILLMEELAIRELESLFSVSINRQISLGSDIGIDGMFVKEQSPHVVEIKYYGGRINIPTVEKQLNELCSKASRINWKRMNVVFVAVIDEQIMPSPERFHSHSKQLSEKYGLGVIFVPLGERELKKKYGVENS